MKSKLNWLLFVVFAAVLSVTYSYTLDKKLDLNGDNATYIALARNMAAGHGYCNATPDGYLPASQFPPGYPFILSLVIRMGIDNLILFKVLNAVFLFAALCLLYLVFSGETRRRWLAVSAVILTCFSIQLLRFAGMAMSEMSYMFFMVFSVFCLWKYAEKDESRFWRSPWFWMALVSAMACYHIRSVGIALVISIVIFLLFRKEWLAALASAGTMALLALPWIIRNKLLGITSRYFGAVMAVNIWRPEEGQISTVGEFISKMISNLDQTVIKGFPNILFPFTGNVTPEPSTVTGIIVGLIVLAVVVYGAWETGRMRWLMLALLAGNIGLFAIWHGGNDTRYVTPIIPFVYLFFYNGVFSVFKLVLRKHLRDETPLALLLLLLILPMIAPLKMLHEVSAQPYPPEYDNYFKLAEMLDGTVPAGTIVCCRKPELFCYFAPHLFATSYLPDTDPDTVIKGMLDSKVEFVIVEQLGFASTRRYLIPALEAHMELFQIIYETPEPKTTLVGFKRRLAEMFFIFKDGQK